MKRNNPIAPSWRKLDDSRSFSKSLEQLGTNVGYDGLRTKYVISCSDREEEAVRNRQLSDKLSDIDFTLSDFRSCININQGICDQNIEKSTSKEFLQTNFSNTNRAEVPPRILNDYSLWHPSTECFTNQSLWRHSNPPPNETFTPSPFKKLYSSTISPQPFCEDRSELAWLCDNLYPNKANSSSDHESSVTDLSTTALGSRFVGDAPEQHQTSKSLGRIDKNNNFGACIFTVTGVPKSSEVNHHCREMNEVPSTISSRKPVHAFPHVLSALERYGRRHKYIDERTVNSNGHVSGDSSQRYLHKTNRLFGSVYRMERELLLSETPTDVLQNSKLLMKSHREGQRLLLGGKSGKDKRLGTCPVKLRERRLKIFNDSRQIEDISGSLLNNTVVLNSVHSSSDLNDKVDVKNKEKCIEPDVCIDEEPTLSVAELKLRFSDGTKPTDYGIKNIFVGTKENKRSNLGKTSNSNLFIKNLQNNPYTQIHKSNSHFTTTVPYTSAIQNVNVDPKFDRKKSNVNATDSTKPSAEIINTTTTGKSESRNYNDLLQVATCQLVAQVNTCSPFAAADLDFGWIDDDDVLCDDFYAGNQSFSAKAAARQRTDNHVTHDVTCCVLEEDERDDDSDESSTEHLNSDRYQGGLPFCETLSPHLSSNLSDGGRTNITDSSLDAMVGLNQYGPTFALEKAVNVVEFNKNSTAKHEKKAQQSIELSLPVHSSVSQSECLPVNIKQGGAGREQFTGEVKTEQRQCSIKDLVETFEGLTNPFLRTGSFKKYSRNDTRTLRRF